MVRHRRRTRRFVSALFLTLFALCMEFVPSTMTASAKSVLSGPATVACSRVRFIGVRGSGDPPQGKPYDKNDQFKGMGQVVYSTYTRFKDKMGDKGVVAGEGLNYDAVPISKYKEMSASVAGGVKELTRLLNANKEDCVVLAGYSQGAWVIHHTLDDILYQLPLSARLRVKAVLAFGDPLFDQKGTGSILLDSPKDDLRSVGGTIDQKAFPSWLFGVQNYCKLNDPICTSELGGWVACAKKGNPCAHLDYYTDKALQERAASWLAGLFPNLISTANSVHPTSPRLVTCSDHMTAPWVALYTGLNYGGQSICFEGRGYINLHPYYFDTEARSVNIAANVVFYDGAGNQISYGYGFQTGDLGAWRYRIRSFVIES